MRRSRFAATGRPLVGCDARERKPSQIARLDEPADLLFKGCQTVDDKLRMLAKVWADAFEWRAEEADGLFHFQKRLTELERRVEQIEANGGTQ